ncbi:hypothetical protein E2C04_11745 [Nocardioides daphniae]|uniref:Uncharacterized protein n=1 Tax=Nocardioides daphniae TaxID=402297 RepID=A0A4P7UFX5_9ACTN|nr:hypothetical protein E2C04_11745 [Nocardioides daphniae]
MRGEGRRCRRGDRRGHQVHRSGQGRHQGHRPGYAKKAKKATVNVKVVNNKKKAVQGKVKLTLKKGKKVVGKRTVTLSKKGVAKGVFTKVKAKGKYTVIAEFQGNKTAKKSKATAKFTVK